MYLKETATKVLDSIPAVKVPSYPQAALLLPVLPKECMTTAATWDCCGHCRQESLVFTPQSRHKSTADGSSLGSFLYTSEVIHFPPALHDHGLKITVIATQI